MDQTKLNEATTLMQAQRHFFIASADGNGMPHVTVGHRVATNFDDLPEVFFWSCPVTLANLKRNRYVAVIVWDSKQDHGFQLLGQAEKLEEYGVLNGHAPEVEKNMEVPQACWRLQVRVSKVLVFTRAIHSDAGV